MPREQNRQTFKLRLLAFVLALLLLWYSLNPAPRPITRIKAEDELPDEKRREVEPRLLRADIFPMMLGTLDASFGAGATAEQDEDDFNWPDLIDA